MTHRIEHLAEGVALHCGDCREILPSLPNVDAVVTDPPYEIAAVGGGIGAKRKYLADISGHIDAGFEADMLASFKNWLVFCGKSQINKLSARAEKSGLRWQLLTWNKTNPTPLTNANYLPDTEYMVHAFVRHDWECKKRFIVGQVEKNEFEHPTVKPLYVMFKAIRSASSFGDSILDPFMGSGTTGVAAVKLGRKFIGVEIEPKYFDIACRRISEALKQPDMFIERPKPAVQNTLDLNGGKTLSAT